MKQKLLDNLRLLLSIAAVTLLMPLSASAQTRIAVVSDIHVMAPDLLANNAASQEPWIKDFAGERKMLDKSAGLFTQFVEALKSSKPDILLITGDLTKDGELASHKYVRDGLAELTASPYNIKVFVIPGNHDIKSSGKVYKYDGTTKTELEAEDLITTADAFATYYNGYGYGDDNSAYDTDSKSYATEPVPGLVIIGIDSHSATISEETLTWVSEQAAAARDNGKQVIAMMHHPLFPHITGADMFIDTYTVGSYETVRNALITAGVNVILTGHFHTSDIAKDWNDDASKAIYDINTGSLISYPCDYRILELSQNKQTLNVSTYSLTPSGMTAAQCKTWLSGRLKSKAEAMMTAKAIEKVGEFAASLAAPYINSLATFAANLFILHAEGDENTVTHQTDRDNLESTYNYYKDDPLYSAALSYGGITDASVYSILDDKSNYGGDHQNQTDDRTLEITMPSLDESVTIPASGWATYCTGHDVDVSLTGGLTAYTVTAVDATTATLTEVTKIPAEEGFLLKGTAGNYTLKPATEAVTAVTNLLKGTLTATAAVEGDYALATKGEGENQVTAFYPVTAGVTIPARKAYFHGTSGAPMLVLGGDGGATGIETIGNAPGSKADCPVYTLQGTRTASLRPGIYIRNGKKLVIK
jgi:3',5'-cyclic AMP phosphodiesterase CpdA